MDLLYFEYLKLRLDNGTIDQALIVPWSGYKDNDIHQEAEHRLKCNLEKIFGVLFPKITILFSSELADRSDELLSEDFFDQLEALGDSAFLRECSLTMGFKFNSYHDINSGHPESLQARSLVEHTIRGWLIYRYLVEHGSLIQTSQEVPLSIGSLLWERELSKTLLLKNLQAYLLEAGFHSPPLGLMIGKSVTYRSGLTRFPLPNYEGGKTLEIFVGDEELAKKCASKSPSELEVVTDIAKAVLEANRSKNAPIFQMASANRSGTVNAGEPLQRHAQTAYQHIRALQSLYGVKP